jgi:O-antigen ligase
MSVRRTTSSPSGGSLSRMVRVAPFSNQGLRHAAIGASWSRDRIGIPFGLALVWLLFEFGRPPTPSGIPLAISAVLFVNWLLKRDKQWSRQAPWWFVLLGVVAVGIFFATNTYSAALNLRLMTTLFLGVCLPLQALITSVRRLRLWIYAMIAVSAYVGAWAITHGGYGPSGGGGGQDENYVAALMTMSTSLAYFSIFADKRLLPRMLLAACIIIFIGAMALADNASRGGFLALCAVALYGLARSPKKGTGVGVLAIGAIALFAIASPAFWKEIDSTTDVHQGTGDIRLEIWAAGMRMWKANPVLGVGSGNFRWVIGNYQTPEQYAKFGHSLTGTIIAHSLPVECIAELGSAGGIATIVLIVATWRGLGRVIREIPGPGKALSNIEPELAQLRCYADAIRGAILAVLVAGTFLSLFYYSHLWVLLAVGSAVPFVYRRIAGLDAGGALVGTGGKLSATQVRGPGAMPAAPVIRRSDLAPGSRP